MINPLEHPICFAEPKLLSPESCWIEHIPFAMFIVELLRPRFLVELGAHRGDSYSAFCQTVKKLKLDTRCFAVDTWAGDQHVGEYGAEILNDLREHHDPLYSSFSELLQKTFDEALVRFDDGQIDLLHIDGCHTYEAVKHDFETWLPKMSPQGIILFHDIAVKDMGFGVWKLWDEVKVNYPHLAFEHCYGLGVLGVGADLSLPAKELLNTTEDEQISIRNFFSAIGCAIAMRDDRVKDSELSKKEEKINALYNSYSWKVTAPLRFVLKFFMK